MPDIASKQIQWVLDKAAPKIVLSKQSITLDSDNLTNTFTITTNSTGNLSVVSSDDSIATVSLSSNTVTVTALANGTCTITVSITESADNNYSSGSKELLVTCNLISTILNDNSWSQISQVAIAGDGVIYWNIGDCKEITLNGKIGNHLTLSDAKLCVFILDFNHPMNGIAENNIIFGGFKTALQNGTDVALVDDQYLGEGTGDIEFSMNHQSVYNYGGWKGCDLRYDILGATSTPPSQYNTDKNTSCVGYDATTATLTNPKADTLLAALPSDLRSNIRLWTRWIDAVGGNSSNVDANIKATVDAITLLAESEIFTGGTQGSDRWANKYEYNHNTRMTYYANGNSIVKQAYPMPSKRFPSKPYVYRLESSPLYSGHRFCIVRADGTAYYSYCTYPYALSPAFKI